MEKFKVRVKKSGKILGWRLRIVDNKTVEITSGLFTDWKKVIEEKRDWIINNLKKVKKSKNLKDLKEIFILNDKYKVNITIGKNDSLIIFEDKKEIYIRSIKLTEKYLKKIIDKKMRTTALKIIREKTKELGEKFNIKFKICQ